MQSIFDNLNGNCQVITIFNKHEQRYIFIFYCTNTDYYILIQWVLFDTNLIALFSWYCIVVTTMWLTLFNSCRLIKVYYVQPNWSGIQRLKIDYTGERDSTSSAVVNKLWAWLVRENIYFSMHKQPIFNQIANCTSGKSSSPV
jgi:hypothetical protein